MISGKKIFYGIVAVVVLTTGVSTQVSAKTYDIAIVVNAKNPMKNMAISFVRDVFLKVRKQWPHGNNIMVLGRKAGSRGRKIFDHVVLGMNARESATYWINSRIRGQASAPIGVDSDMTVVRIVAKQRNAIGYVLATPDMLKLLSNWDSSGLAASPNMTARIVKIDGVLPKQPKYPIRGAPSARD